jgi:hypothetical protein
MKGIFVITLTVASVVLGFTGARAESKISAATEECLGCHTTIHPGIVEGWKKSRHAATTPAEALAVEGLARKITGQNIPEDLKNVSLGCAECHSLNGSSHKDTFDHNGTSIHVVVSPKDCATCHVEEAGQFDKNLMAHAHGILVNNSLYKTLMGAINDTPLFDKGKVTTKPANAHTEAESCLYCHGTKLEVTGSVTRETDMGEMTFPVISGWPNQGVGRINLDGSRGSCAACHTRHEFSIEMARKPYTCRECHVGPDVPANKVYEASKHGNIFSSKNSGWNFTNVPWTVGKDFTAPTCAACHMSLLTDTEGKVVVKRSHEVKDRLPYRIFGLVYAHSHPREPDTSVIRNKDGLPLPTDFTGGSADKFLYDEKERAAAQKAMQASCLSCHHQSWVDGHWERFVNTIGESNAAVLAGTRIMTDIWQLGLAANHQKGGSPFDEYIERVWSDSWLFYANTIRFASAMGGGGDYGVFADGRYQLSKAVRQLEDWLNQRKPAKGKPSAK